MTKIRIRVDLGSNLTTSVSDDGWEVTGPEHIACWKSAQKILAGRPFLYKKDKLSLTVNWNPAVRRVRRAHAAMQKFMAALAERAPLPYDAFPRSSVKVDFAFDFKAKLGQSTAANSLAHLAEYYLYDFFLAMNLSHPGSCDFNGAKVPSFKSTTALRLSSYFFEIAELRSRENHWPAVSNLPLESTVKWLQSIRTDMKLVPKNRMERVAFAILHICSSEMSPSTIIWIFYGLESLFDTKAGENFRALISRIELLLSPTPSQKQSLKKQLRELYDLRSSFVHGGMEVIHPMHNELLDREVDEKYGRLIDAANFGFQVLLASTQEVIRRDWREPQFQEVLLDSRSN